MDIEITKEMIEAGIEAKLENEGEYGDVADCLTEIYRAMELQRLESCAERSNVSSGR